METKLKKFRVYAPPDCKSYGLNDDGTLTITGIASTTNEDLDGEIITPYALKSLAQQVIGLNLHMDHNHHYDGGIGVITDAELEEGSLRITAVVLSEYAEGIKERLDLGMNFGFSIGGIPVRDTLNPMQINDFMLLEMSLTLLPANWDTFGTVETKGIVQSKCLTGACHYILKNKSSDKMEGKDANNQLVVTDEVKQALIDIVNEAVFNLKPQILDEIKGELSTIIQDTVTEVVSDLIPAEKDAEEVIEDSEEDVEEIEEDCIDEKEVAEDEAPVDEEAETPAEEETEVETKAEEEEAEEASAEEAPVDETEEDVVEEEKEVTDDPVNGVEEEAEVEYVESSEAPKVIVDVKSIGEEIAKQVSLAMKEKSFKDELVRDIESSIYKKLDAKRKESSTKTESKLKTYEKSVKKPSKKHTFLDSDKRDRFGRNKKFL